MSKITHSQDPSFIPFPSGTFDGPMAYRMLLERLSGGAGERAKHDKAYYEAAVTLQISNRLPDGAAAEEYDKRAIAFLEYIQPNLERPYSPEGVSNY